MMKKINNMNQIITDELFAKLDSFRELKQGWAGDESEIISEHSIEKAKKLIPFLLQADIDDGIYEGKAITVTPTPEGNINIEIRECFGDKFIEYEIEIWAFEATQDTHDLRLKKEYEKTYAYIKGYGLDDFRRWLKINKINKKIIDQQ